MKTQITERTRVLLEDSWRLTPARMAERLTNGRFQRYRYIQFLEKRLAQSISRGSARLLVTMPPRHGKSWLASLFTPAWYLSLWPERNVILTTHDLELAAGWGRSIRRFLRTHQDALGRVQGEVITAGVGGPIAGRGGHLLIVDDPIKSLKEACSERLRRQQIDWFNSELYTRAEPDASIIVIMNRWHEDDLAGHIKRHHAHQWDILEIPAIAGVGDALGRSEGDPLCQERFDATALSQIRDSVGSRVWQALYQQSPLAESGHVLKREWWKYYEALPESFDEVIQSWDMAFKDTGDYVVGQVWGRKGANKYLIDQVRAKMDFQATLKAVWSFSQKYPQAHKKLIEDKANGSAVVSMLKETIPGLVVVEPIGGKQARVSEISAQIESGNVFLPARARWVEELVNECSAFPESKHDDQVDAMAYALNHFNKGGALCTDAMPKSLEFIGF